MGQELVNDCVLIPERPDWANPIRWRRQWSTGVGNGVTGAEDRSASRLKPYVSIDFRTFNLTLQQNRKLHARLLQALKHGRVAVPQWHRAQYLKNFYPHIPSGATYVHVLGLWRWKAGDYAMFLNAAGQHEVVKLTDGTAWDLLRLPNELIYNYHVHDLVLPILFGTLKPGNASAITDHLGDYQLTISEPAGQGNAVTLGSCPVSAPQLYSAQAVSCAGEITVSLQDLDACPKAYRLTWTADPYANSYEIQSRDVGAGTWNAVATVTAYTHDLARPYRVDREYRVRSLVGATPGDWSETITVSAMTIEGVMRAVQERRYATDQVTIAWPDGAPNYPADGYYDAAITTGGAAKEVELIQAIADALNDNTFLGYYSQLADLSDVAHDATLAVYSNSVAPFNALPMTVTEGSRQAQLAALAAMCCALQSALEIAPMTGWEHKFGFDNSGTATAGETIVLSSGRYDTHTPDVGGSAHPEVTAYSYNNYGNGIPDPYWVSGYSSIKARYEIDLTDFGASGEAILFLAVGPPPAFEDVLDAGEKIGNFPPVGVTDKTFQRAMTVNLPYAGTYQTSYFGDAKSVPPSPDSEFPRGVSIGWQVFAAKWLILKSNVPSAGHWQYYP